MDEALTYDLGLCDALCSWRKEGLPYFVESVVDHDVFE